MDLNSQAQGFDSETPGDIFRLLSGESVIKQVRALSALICISKCRLDRFISFAWDIRGLGGLIHGNYLFLEKLIRYEKKNHGNIQI